MNASVGSAVSVSSPSILPGFPTRQPPRAASSARAGAHWVELTMTNTTAAGAAPGANLLSLETPVPIVDLDRLEQNLQRMASYTSQHGLALRPHVKTHKTPWIAARQVALGAVGPHLRHAAGGGGDERRRGRHPGCVSAGGQWPAAPPDVASARPPAHGRARLCRRQCRGSPTRRARRVAGLASTSRWISACTAWAWLRRRRRSTSHGSSRANPSLEFRGMAFYPGHIRAGVDAQDEAIARLRADVMAAREAFERAGIELPVVSGGSTPTAWRAHETGATEVRPGTYVFNDRTTALMGACTWDDCALTVLATVVSTAVPGQAVIDAGAKALGREPLRAEGDGFGVLMAHPRCRREGDERGTRAAGPVAHRLAAVGGRRGAGGAQPRLYRGAPQRPADRNPG